MITKTKAKHDQIKQADLNYITSKSLGEVVYEMQTNNRHDISVHVVYYDDDTALFEMNFIRENRTSAEVVGRLQNWAGDMTHVHGYGRIFRTSANYVSMFFRGLFLIALFSPCIVWLLALFSSGEVSMFLSKLIAWSVGLSVLTMIYFMNVVTVMDKQSRNLNLLIGNPHQDHKRLIDYLTEIVRDEHYDSDQPSIANRDVEPLSPAELELLSQQKVKRA